MRQRRRKGGKYGTREGQDRERKKRIKRRNKTLWRCKVTNTNTGGTHRGRERDKIGEVQSLKCRSTST